MYGLKMVGSAKSPSKYGYSEALMFPSNYSCSGRRARFGDWRDRAAVSAVGDMFTWPRCHLSVVNCFGDPFVSGTLNVEGEGLS